MTTSPGRASAAPAVSTERIVETGAVALAARIRARGVSPVEVVDAVLDRIQALQPAVNAFITVTASAACAAARREERAVMAAEALGPLHGVPFSVKDLLFTAGVRTTMGSVIHADQVPDADAVPVHRLYEAGAILVGHPRVWLARGDEVADAVRPALRAAAR